MSWVNRISNLFRRNQIDEELEEELKFHLDARTRDNLNAGMNAAAAQHDARRRFGNATLAREWAHEVNIVVSIETVGLMDTFCAFGTFTRSARCSRTTGASARRTQRG